MDLNASSLDADDVVEVEGYKTIKYEPEHLSDVILRVDAAGLIIHAHMLRLSESNYLGVLIKESELEQMGAKKMIVLPHDGLTNADHVKLVLDFIYHPRTPPAMPVDLQQLLDLWDVAALLDVTHLPDTVQLSIVNTLEGCKTCSCGWDTLMNTMQSSKRYGHYNINRITYKHIVKHAARFNASQMDQILQHSLPQLQRDILLRNMNMHKMLPRLLDAISLTLCENLKHRQHSANSGLQLGVSCLDKWRSISIEEKQKLQKLLVL